MTEGWDDVIMHLTAAQKIAKELPRASDGWWDAYVDDMDCDSALVDLIEAAKTELSRPSGDADPGNIRELPEYMRGIIMVGLVTSLVTGAGDGTTIVRGGQDA
jgi:hypothetical protein